MTSEGSKQRNCPVIPPSTLLVQKFTESRAPEVDSLYSTIASRLNNDFRSQRNKRRRTTGHDNRASKTRFRKKRKVNLFGSEENLEKNVNKAPPRHIRRRKELNKNLESGFCTSGDGSKRLRTHVWHAKRFTMIKRWGFHLPLGVHGRGKGSRALLKWLKNGTVVHDASYYSAVQLQGSQDSLMLILSTVMSPLPSSDTENVLSGGSYATSMLHHAGAINSRTIAPVIYIWRPIQQSTDAQSACGQTNGLRKLWIWIHAAALTEGYKALKSACESQGKVNEDFASPTCISLEGRFGTLEVMGSKASKLLQKILRPVIMSENSSVLKNYSLMGAVEEHIPCSGITQLTVNDPRTLTMENTEFDHSYTDLWDAENRLYCPVEESILCTEKHHQRLLSFCLAEKNSADINASNGTHSSRICPVILLRRNNLMDSVTRWSIILPLSWVKAFWVPLVSLDARAIGLRERSWVACEAGIPNFPSEFPECESYASLMEANAAAMDEEAALRPASMKPFSIPIPPPWNCVRLAFKTNPTESDAASELALSDNDIVVARSSRMLAGFLNASKSDHLPLFPYFSDKNMCLSKTVKDEKILDRALNTDGFLGNRINICFVRVVLRAYKEGAIEDGAVVCAPRLADIKLWTSCSSQCDLQVSQSSMTSYFVQQEFGKWEFKVPEDPAAMEASRWPIGFVTSGFVHGSKKPSGGGLCDAVLLARLRHEQWSSVPLKRRKKEIYVLTRNLRSTAYRLALATVVLEHQQEDLDCI